MNKEIDHELPFIIGISGHRDIANLANNPDLGIVGVKCAIKECLNFWKKKIGKYTPIWLITGMAEGADLLAIEAVRELVAEGWQEAYIKVIPCLPMPQHAFEMDLSSRDTLKIFKSYMVDYTDNTITLKSNLPETRYQAALIDLLYGRDRASLYMNLAGFLARTCNVILCLWDGLDGNGSGGTADVVKLKLGMEVNWPIEDEYISKALQQPESLDRHFGGVVQHIPVDRHTPSSQPSIVSRFLATTAEIKHSKYICYVSTSLGNETSSICQQDQSRELRTLVHQLTTYNTDIQLNLNKGQILYPHPSLLESDIIFQKADGFAQKFQSIYRNRMVSFFSFSMVGLGAYELIGIHIGKPSGILLNIVILFSILFCWYFIQSAKKKQWKWKYQIARGIAESLRIRGFLNLANIEPDNHPLLHRRYKNKLPIFEQAITIAEIEWWKHPKFRDDQRVKDQWLIEQRDFLAKRTIKSEPLASLSTLVFQRPRIAQQYLGYIAKSLFIFAVFLGGGLLILQANIYTNISQWPLRDITYWVMILIQYSIMIAGTTTLWIELANYQSTTSGYYNLIQLYEIALNNIDTKNDHLINVTLRSLAKEALLEHCEWSHYESLSDIQSKR